jgi:hypothetical protein
MALGPLEEFGRIEIMDRVSPGTIFTLEFKQFILGRGEC